MTPRGYKKDGTPLGGHSKSGRKMVDDPKTTLSIPVRLSIKTAYKTLSTDQKQAVSSATERAIKRNL